jgi:hypothetical protein
MIVSAQILVLSDALQKKTAECAALRTDSGIQEPIDEPQ